MSRLGGEGHHSAKLTEAKVRKIREAHTVGVTCTALAYQYGVGIGTVSLLVRGLIWKRAGGPTRGNTLNYHYNNKVTPAQVRNIRLGYAMGAHPIDLAREYAVSYSAVKNIVYRRTWRGI